ncbi:hypothetical protein Aduo_017582 [Ancylostoma duodenale]
MIKSSVRKEWQSKCLIAYFNLLFSEDYKVTQAALGGLEQQASSSCGFLSTVLELCELNLNSAHKLSAGLRVVAALFAAHCESYMMSVVQEQATVDRLTLPRLPEQILLDRLLVMPLRSLGWLKTDMLSKVHNPPPNEIAPALELFEGFVTVLLQVYGAFQSVPCKRAILGVMCELPRDGIIYAMADPKKVLFEAVTTQLYDPGAGNKELLTEIALYLIVLARTTVIKYDQVSRVAIELIERATQNNVNEILSAVEVILLETLFVQRSNGQMIYSVFRSKSTSLFNMSSQRTLMLWTLFLHSSRNDENSWSSMSIDFFAAYSEFSTECCESALSHSVFAVVTTFACMAPAMYRPVDSVFQLFQNSVDNEDIPLSTRLKQTVPLLFAIFNNVGEEKLLMRIEQMIEKPLEWLVSTIYDLLLTASSASARSGGLFVDYTIFLFQTIVNLIKAESYPKLCAALQARLRNVEYLSFHRLVATQPALLSQWLQLMNLCDEPLTKHLDFDLCTEYVMRLAVSLSPLSKDLTLQSSIMAETNSTPMLPAKSSLVEFCKAVFSESLWCRNPRVFRTLLSLESPDIYYVYESVPEDKRECFLGHLVNSISTGLVSQMVFPDAYKAAVAKSQEVLDVIYDLVEFEGEANKDALRLKLYVLSRLSLLLFQSTHDLSWGDFTSNELLALLEFAAVELTLPKCDLRATCDGLVFLLEHKSTRDIFTRDILYGIQSIKKILLSILLFLGEKNSSKFDHSSVSDKISVIAGNSAVFSSDFEEFGGLDGFIVTLFNDVHNICHVFRSQSRKYVQYFEKFCRVILRHPVLHRFAIVPYTALKMNWKLRIELRENTIHVPLVNIHLLCNIDILKDFSWRLNWLGWISRQQFEDFWMSLFGVLSSTPTGSELTTENSSSLAEQILASSFAVSVLTDILIYSLIYPEPGNPSTGRFIIKHRERNEPFYQSKSMQLLCLLKARLTRDQEPLQVYRRNLERLNYVGDEYGFGQLSALSLWTLTGVLNDENPHQLAKTDSPVCRVK